MTVLCSLRFRGISTRIILQLERPLVIEPVLSLAGMILFRHLRSLWVFIICTFFDYHHILGDQRLAIRIMIRKLQNVDGALCPKGIIDFDKLTCLRKFAASWTRAETCHPLAGRSLYWILLNAAFYPWIACFASWWVIMQVYHRQT